MAECLVTGVVKDLTGAVVANGTVTFTRQGGVISFGGAVRVPELVTVSTGSGGELSVTLVTGNYSMAFQTPQGRYVARIGVPDTPTANIIDLFAAPIEVINPLVQQAREYRDEAEAAAALAVAAADEVPPDYAARADFVAANTATPGLGLSDGKVVTAGGYQYRRLASSTAISDLAGWVPNGDATPQHFGAVGNGVADDTAPIQAAVDYIGGIGGGLVHIPAGTYRNAGVNILFDNVEIVGDGWATKIVFTSVTPGAAFNFGQTQLVGGLTAVSACAVRKMQIDGNRGGGAIGTGVRTTLFDGFTLEEVHVYDCAQNYGFTIVGTGLTPRNDITVKNCSAHNCGADGLDIKAGAERVIIDGFLSGSHVVETDGGTAVGLDIRGNKVSVQNVFCYDCVFIGIRVRINAGDKIASDWELTEKAQISLTNCYVWDCGQDGFSLELNRDGAIVGTGVHARDCGRYGFSVITVDAGSVVINGGSAIDCLVGINGTGENTSFSAIGMTIYGASTDAIRVTSGGTYSFTGGMIKNSGRWGVDLRGVTSGVIAFSGTVFDTCLRAFQADATTTGGYVSAENCAVLNCSQGGVALAGSAIRARFAGGRFASNAVNVLSESSDTTFRDVDGVVSFARFVQSVSIASIATVDFSITHGLYKAPRADQVRFVFERVTDVADYVIGHAVVRSASGTVLLARCRISTASATAGATVNLHTIIDLSGA